MKKVKGGQANATLLACIYGQPKVKKTTLYLAASKPFRPMAVLDTDGGAAIRLKVLTMPKKEREALGVMEDIPSWMGPWMAEGIDFFYPDKEKIFDDCFQWALAEADNYKLIVVDSVSRLGDDLLDEVKTKQYTGVTKRTTRISIGNTTKPSLSDYSFAQHRVQELLKALNNSSAHVVLISHEKISEIKLDPMDPQSPKRVVGGPRVCGAALTEILPATMDVTLRIATKSKFTNGKLLTTPLLRTRNHDMWLAGDRSGMFEDNEPLDEQVFWSKIEKVIQISRAKAQ